MKLNLLDFFAASALERQRGGLPADYSTGTHNELAAERAYDIAEAMLLERNKRMAKAWVVKALENREALSND